MEFFTKITENPAADLFWNLPETPKGAAHVIGGNAQSFQTVVRTAEFLAANYPLASVDVVLPASLRPQLPPLPNFRFLPATATGSFSGAELASALEGGDYNLIAGDLSKNAITAQAVTTTLATVTTPTLVTRDAVDLLAAAHPEKVLLNASVNFLASASQLQKLLRAVYYPKVMTLSQPLLQIAEILHKFTLSFATGIITLHDAQILVAKHGTVQAVPLSASGFSPLTLWGGQFAAQIVALNLFNPSNFVAASVAAIFHHPDKPEKRHL